MSLPQPQWLASDLFTVTESDRVYGRSWVRFPSGTRILSLSHDRDILNITSFLNIHILKPEIKMSLMSCYSKILSLKCFFRLQGFLLKISWKTVPRFMLFSLRWIWHHASLFRPFTNYRVFQRSLSFYETRDACMSMDLLKGQRTFN